MPLIESYSFGRMMVAGSIYTRDVKIIICGTGAMGVMRPSDELQEYLAATNIEFIALRSPKAVEIYNQMTGKKKLAGCFHLTC
jgi:hypothetical protein